MTTVNATHVSCILHIMHMHMHSSRKESGQQVATYLPSDHTRTNERTKNHQTPSAVAPWQPFLLSCGGRCTLASRCGLAPRRPSFYSLTIPPKIVRKL